MRARLARAYGLARSLLIYHGNPVRRRQARRHYARFVRPGDLCFDVGAHVGDRVSAFVHLGARVVAVEPQPHVMALLRRIHGHNPAVTLVEAAVGPAPGTASLLVSERAPTVSTLSHRWSRQVGRSARFRGVRWRQGAPVAVTTLDDLIARYGSPAFCKIDVEGFELEALKGLSTPLPCLSVEYVPAAVEIALACVERLCRLGPYRFNLSVGETKRLIFEEWRDAAAIAAWLRDLRPEDPSGDLYARLADPGLSA